MRFDGTNNVMTYTYFYIAQNVQKIQEMSPDAGEEIELFDVSFDEFLDLARSPLFHHHWNLLPLLYEALISEEKKKEMFTTFFSVS
jgi:hypothetical protein